MSFFALLPVLDTNSASIWIKWSSAVALSGSKSDCQRKFKWFSLKRYWMISCIYTNHFLLLMDFKPSKYNTPVFYIAIPLHFLGLSSLNSTPLFCFPEDPAILSFKKGDLLILTEDKRLDAKSDWICAQNERTGKTGNVFLEEIYIIPSLTKPSSQVLVRKAKCSFWRDWKINDINSFKYDWTCNCKLIVPPKSDKFYTSHWSKEFHSVLSENKTKPSPNCKGTALAQNQRLSK